MALSRAAVLMRDLPLGTCRWPLGDVEDVAFRWCGAVALGGPYCRQHHAASLKRNEPEQPPMTQQQRREVAAWFRHAAGGRAYGR